MTTETVNILALILGDLALIQPLILSYFTNKLIQKEDEIAKKMIEATQKMIDEGNKRLEKFIMETQRMIDEGNKRLEILLSEVIKRV
ncbi:MAG: hypothetical protein ABIN20_06625 [candidate division WOR-3 bacterium]